MSAQTPTPGEVMVFGMADAARSVSHHLMSRINRVVDSYNTLQHPLTDDEQKSLERILMARVRLRIILEDYDTLMEGLA